MDLVNITEPEIIALIGLGVASLSSLAPLLTIVITWKQKHRDKLEDYARQDEVAAEAARRQDQVAAQAAEAARLLIAANERVALQNKETQGRLKEIHTLVNSNLTKEMQDRLIAVTGQVALTKEIIRLNRVNKMEPSPETVISLENLEGVVKGLTVLLQERMVSTDRAAVEKNHFD